MSETSASAPAARPTPVCHTVIVGRVSHVRAFNSREGRRIAHVLTLPAPDQYSSPAVVEVTAPQQLGSVGDDLRVLCRVHGFRSNFDIRDEMTGEKRNVQSATVRLEGVQVL